MRDRVSAQTQSSQLKQRQLEQSSDAFLMELIFIEAEQSQLWKERIVRPVVSSNQSSDMCICDITLIGLQVSQKGKIGSSQECELSHSERYERNIQTFKGHLAFPNHPQKRVLNKIRMQCEKPESRSVVVQNASYFLYLKVVLREIQLHEERVFELVEESIVVPDTREGLSIVHPYSQVYQLRQILHGRNQLLKTHNILCDFDRNPQVTKQRHLNLFQQFREWLHLNRNTNDNSHELWQRCDVADAEPFCENLPLWYFSDCDDLEGIKTEDGCHFKCNAMFELICKRKTIKTMCEIDEVFSDWLKVNNEILLGRVKGKPTQ